MVDSYKKYTKEDYDNIILKKERLILERNADLFPEGCSKLALELYNTYESVKSKVRYILKYDIIIDEQKAGQESVKQERKRYQSAKTRPKSKKQIRKIEPPEKVVDSSFYDEEDPDLAIFKKYISNSFNFMQNQAEKGTKQ